MPANRVKEVAKVAGVVAVQVDAVAHPLTDSSRDFIGAPTIYDELGSIRVLQDRPRGRSTPL